MRFLAIALLVPGLARAQAPRFKPEELCTVSGVARNAVSGDPLAKASVVLLQMDRPNQSLAPSTTTDGEGRFAMNGIEPGQYRTMAQRVGFVSADQTGGTPSAALTLAKGQTLSGVEIKLTPQSVVTGRITDQDGDPVPFASISLARPRYIRGKRQLMPVGSAQSNDLGEYRLFGVSGGLFTGIRG